MGKLNNKGVVTLAVVGFLSFVISLPIFLSDKDGTKKQAIKREAKKIKKIIFQQS